MSIKITAASAGTGKTYHLCSIISDALASDPPSCRPGAFIATTFTTKAAAELKERVRARLLENPIHGAEAALRVDEALIGTVHSVCARILERFAFEAGISPRLRVLDEALETLLLGASVEECFGLSDIGAMERLSQRLGQNDSRTFESKWRDQVRGIISAARSNDIGQHQLPDMAKKSIKELLAFLPAPTGGDLEKPLQAAIESALASIPLNDDTTKKTQDVLITLHQALSDLRGGNLKWSDWCRLAKLAPGKASLDDVHPVNEAASKYENNPKLREDIESYITRIFGFAADAMAAYQDRKKARGMLDYTDLEVLTLKVIEHKHVQECIREEYDLMVVDEFQDTSPLQLALFVRLAELVKKAEWVGDTKQAIYGFRGADPELMRAAGMKFEKGMPLETSRRHRAELLEFFNSLFPAVFEKNHGMGSGEVAMQAYRVAQTSLPPAIEIWALSSGRVKKDGTPSAVKSDEADDCIVRGILELMDSRMKVSNKARQKNTVEFLRPISWRDIAVLSYTNKKASSIAAKLLAAGVPAARKTKGLLGTPEAVLAMACLRWLNDTQDSVAVAEILSLEECREIEAWLTDRLQWRRDGRTGRWGLDGDGLKSKVLARIAPLRERSTVLTPSELLDAALVHGDVFGIASQWGASRAENRRSNLEALRGLAAEYESECISASTAASHAGFLIWCDSLVSSEQDLSAFDESMDAVQVMTWHGAKGLEWPVVICLDLDGEPRPRIWNTPTVLSESAFHPDTPLADRNIRFWPYPFGQQLKDVPLCDSVLESKAGRAAVESAEREQSRLQYVAMTRARDVLILPQFENKSPWLPEGVHCDVFRSPADKAHEDLVGMVRRKIRHLIPQDAAQKKAPASSVHWFAPPSSPQVFARADLTPSSLPPIPNSQSGEEISYGPSVPISAGNIEQDIGNALHAIIATHLSDPEGNLAALVAKVLASYRVNVDGGAITAAVTAFHESILTRFQPSKILVEVPFASWNEEGQRIAGNIDLVLMTAKGVVLIDHKSYSGTNLHKHSNGYSGQIAAYREALISNGFSVASSWIHFCTQGKLIGVL